MRPICLILPIFKNYFLLPGIKTEAKISNHNTSATTTQTTTTAAAATAGGVYATASSCSSTDSSARGSLVTDARLLVVSICPYDGLNVTATHVTSNSDNGVYVTTRGHVTDINNGINVTTCGNVSNRDVTS